MNSEESVFVRKALEDAEKAQKYSRVKQIVVMLLLFAALLWVAFQPSPAVSPVQLSILAVLAVAVWTTRIVSLINKNTSAILRAIADLQRPATGTTSTMR
jgi:RsiW-degrading membrane proteinase PrsW (M82 family)